MAQALFVKQSIEIEAPASRVWQVLTSRDLTRHWVPEFFGQPAELVSGWQLGSTVYWNMLSDGKTYVEGTITLLEPSKTLRYTVFDIRSERPPVSDEDGITFTLVEREGHTQLSVMQGDFGKMPDGEKYYNASVAVWERVMPKIK